MKRSVDTAIKLVDRSMFLPPKARGLAGLDMPLSIGYGVTNSQPTTVRLMLEWLDVRPGQKILDVGSGSGWTTALLAFLAGPKGNVIAVERIPELVKFGKKNCETSDIKNVSFHLATDIIGYPKSAPYDRILVSASANNLPEELLEQLAYGGKMVVPVKEDMLIIEKDKRGGILKESIPGFVFVPLISGRQK